MNLLLLHGAAITSSRNKLNDFKKGFDPNNVLVFEEGTSFETINNHLTATSLFPSDKLVILENPPEDFINYTLYPIPYTLVFWFDHEIGEKKPIFEWVKKLKGEILNFSESKEISVFPFLDKLGMRDKSAYLEMDKLKKAGLDGQYLITMIFYLLRSLVADPKNAKDFVKSKNARMRANFSNKELVELYKFVLETDFKLKKGLMNIENAQFLLVQRFVNFF